MCKDKWIHMHLIYPTYSNSTVVCVYVRQKKIQSWHNRTIYYNTNGRWTLFFGACRWILTENSKFLFFTLKSLCILMWLCVCIYVCVYGCVALYSPLISCLRFCIVKTFMRSYVRSLLARCNAFMRKISWRQWESERENIHRQQTVDLQWIICVSAVSELYVYRHFFWNCITNTTPAQMQNFKLLISFPFCCFTESNSKEKT